MQQTRERGYGHIKSWMLNTSLVTAGIIVGAVLTYLYLYSPPRKITFDKDWIPTLMMHPLGHEGAFLHRIDNWQLLTSATTGNDSLALKYNDQFIASVTAAPDRRLESIIINHPRHDNILLILEGLNEQGSVGKLTTDILSKSGDKIGFVIDEDLDGQADLRFEYAGPYLYVWLKESWHRVMRTTPRETGRGFKHTVMYNQSMHEIHLERYPYELEPLEADD